MSNVCMELRDYSRSNRIIYETYRQMIQNQTVDYVTSMKQHYQTYPNIKCPIWDVIQRLDQVVDESDPDNDLPQIVHACQTGAFITYMYLDHLHPTQLNKKITIKELFTEEEWCVLPYVVLEQYKEIHTLHQMYPHIEEWDWFPLIGFIHDLGKVLILEDFGGLPQWSVVGDTFPVGCIYSYHNVFHEKRFHRANPDCPKYRSFLGKYQEHCGLDQVDMSYGHDEYLATVLEKKNKTRLPKEAIYLIRYHSFYAWHSPRHRPERGYTHLANAFDWKMLPLLKAFQKADLYSKVESVPELDQVKKVFESLIVKYIGQEPLLW